MPQVSLQICQILAILKNLTTSIFSPEVKALWGVSVAVMLIMLFAGKPPVDPRTQTCDILTAKLYLLGSSLFWLGSHIHTLSHTHMRVAVFKPGTDGRAAVISDLEKVPCWRGLMFDSLGFAWQRKNPSCNFFRFPSSFHWKSALACRRQLVLGILRKTKILRAFRYSDVLGQSKRLHQTSTRLI